MDELQKRRTERAIQQRTAAADSRSPDIELHLWLHEDGGTTREIAGTAEMKLTSYEQEERAIDVLLGGVCDTAQDFADDEVFEDSWQNEPVFLVFANRKGMRYIMPHKFFLAETVTPRGRWLSTIYMLGRTWKLLTWGLRLTWVCARGIKSTPEHQDSSAPGSGH